MTARVPVVFTFDDRVLRPAAAALTSLLDAAQPETRYEIHVLHPGFSDDVMRAYSGMVEPRGHSIAFHRVDPSRVEGLPAGRGSWTEVVYYRFLIPETLPNLDRAIYSDMDVFFAGDLSSLMELPMQECPLGAVIGEVNGPDLRCHTHFAENQSPHVFMSGFLLMDLERMREERTADEILDVARRHGNRLRMFDLEAMNLACDRILPLPFEYCVLESLLAAPEIEQAPEYPWLAKAHGREALLRARADPVIVHFAGALGKPWRRPDPPEYYQGVLDRVPPELDRRTMRDHRKFWTAKVRSWLRGGRR